jgi:hypothetical protein
MSRGARFECPKAIAARGDVEMLFTGHGFENYNGEATVAENLKAIGFDPDVAFAYKPEDVIGFRDLKCLKVVAYNEAWWPDERARNEAKTHKIDLVICHHRNDLWRFKGMNAVHIPHAANPKIFLGNKKTSDRRTGCLLTGAIDKDIYPLRTSMSLAITHTGLPGFIRRHPGYRLSSEAACDAQYADYARTLGDAQISMCCSSKYRYFLCKIIESLMSGAIVVTDAPDDLMFDKYLSEHCILVEPNAKPNEIADRINEECPGIRGKCEKEHERQAAGTKAALEHFSTERYAERFVAAVRTALAS